MESYKLRIIIQEITQFWYLFEEDVAFHDIIHHLLSNILWENQYN